MGKIMYKQLLNYLKTNRSETNIFLEQFKLLQK